MTQELSAKESMKILALNQLLETDPNNAELRAALKLVEKAYMKKVEPTKSLSKDSFPKGSVREITRKMVLHYFSFKCFGEQQKAKVVNLSGLYQPTV